MVQLFVYYVTDVTAGQTTVALFNTTATTVNAFGQSTALNLGASSGTATINNGSVSFPNATSLVSGTGLANIFIANTGTTNLLTGSAGVTIGAIFGNGPSQTATNSTMRTIFKSAIRTAPLYGAIAMVVTGGTWPGWATDSNTLTGIGYETATNMGPSTGTAFTLASSSLNRTFRAYKTSGLVTLDCRLIQFNFSAGNGSLFYYLPPELNGYVTSGVIILSTGGTIVGAAYTLSSQTLQINADMPGSGFSTGTDYVVATLP